MLPEQHIYKVSEINKIVKDLLEKKFPDIWLEGEISNFKLHSMGHMYFSLKDEEAQINAVMYKGLTGQLKFLPEDGMKILLRGKISLFNKRGQYQIIAFEMQPAGKGALQVAFEQLKEKLRKEGLFDEARKRPIPLLPQKIGIITSPTGAAIKDILTVIKRRFANVEVLIDPVRVQGDEAAPEIALAIEEMNDNFPELDVLILARGGGSLEDLWAFNEEVVARAIYASKLPVISAVGHDVDFTISDFVADLRAPTPSVAAELVVTNKEELVNTIVTYRRRLGNNLKHVYELYNSRYARARDSMIFRRPMEFIGQLQQQLDSLIDRMGQTAVHFIQIQKSDFKLLIEKLNILNPLAILGRGYSIAYKLPEEKIVRDYREVSLQDKIKIKLHKGKLICTVDQKEEIS